MHDDNADWEILAARLGRGDESAGRQLFKSLYPHVWRMASATLGPDPELEDVVQTALLEIFRSLPQFRASARLSTWIYRLVVNVCLQHVRRKKRRAIPCDPTSWNESLAANQSSPDERALNAEKIRILQDVLAEMAPKKRLVFVMHDVEGLEVDEISERLGINRLTVKSRLFYARRAFEKSLRQLDFIEDARRPTHMKTTED